MLKIIYIFASLQSETTGWQIMECHRKSMPHNYTEKIPVSGLGLNA